MSGPRSERSVTSSLSAQSDGDQHRRGRGEPRHTQMLPAARSREVTALFARRRLNAAMRAASRTGSTGSTIAWSASRSSATATGVDAVFVLVHVRHDPAGDRPRRRKRGAPPHLLSQEVPPRCSRERTVPIAHPRAAAASLIRQLLQVTQRPPPRDTRPAASRAPARHRRACCDREIPSAGSARTARPGVPIRQRFVAPIRQPAARMVPRDPRSHGTTPSAPAR